MSFPAQVEAAVLAGGPVGELTSEFAGRPVSKGMVTVGGLPMAALTLQAVRRSPQVRRVVVVSPLPQLDGPEWEGVDAIVPAQDKLMDSFCQGVQAAEEPTQPMLICCGDLPLLTAEAVSDFVQRCRQRPEADIWYCYMRQETAQKRFPEAPHTWAKLADGTFCGTGMMMLRPSVVQPVRQAMENLTRTRKNMFKLAGALGWGTLFYYAVGRLTVRRAEAAGLRIFGVPCAGIESVHAETSFNVDDNEGLTLARKWISEVG